MASLNKVQIIGNLGKDPELRTFPDGGKVANITVATTDKWKDKTTGEVKEATEWHRVNFNGRLAEIVGEYLKKGSQVYIEGSLKTRKWTDKDGIEKYSTEIRADSMKMLGARAQTNEAPVNEAPRQQAAPVAAAASAARSGFEDMDDDLVPF